MNKKVKTTNVGWGVVISVCLILLSIFVIAQHQASPGIININEDTSSVINITLNNLDAASNITHVNISLPAGVVYTAGSYGSSMGANFTNLSSVLSWGINNTGYLVLNLTNATFTFNVSVANPGIYIINLTSTNSTDSTQTSNITITVNDITKPSIITVLLPKNATYGAVNGTMRFNISATDNVNASTCMYSFDWGAVNVSMTSLNDSDWRATNSTMSQGSHVITFYCKDDANNKNSTNVTFGYDSLGPALLAFTGLTSVSSSLHNASVVTINITNITDVGAGKIWWFNNTANVSYVPYQNLTLADGSYTFIIYANDSVDNLNYSASRTFTVDTGIPNVSFVGLTNTTYSDSTIIVNISSSDLTALYVKWSNGTDNATYTSVVTLTNLSNGNYSFWAYANDSVQHKNSTQVNFTVADTTAPSMTVSSPLADYLRSYNYNTNVSLNISSDSMDVESWWWSLNAGKNNHTFTPNTSIPAAEGGNTLYVYVNDTVGNMNSTSVNFSIPITTEEDSFSSGGASTVVNFVYKISNGDLQKGFSRSIRSGDKFNFSVGTEYHLLALISLNASQATVTLSSTPQTASLAVGDEKKFDVNNDNIYDVLVQLKSISGTYANILINATSGVVPSVSAAEQNVTSPEENQTATQQPTVTSTGMTLKGKILWGVVIVAIIIVIVIIYLFLRKHRYAHKGY